MNDQIYKMILKEIAINNPQTDSDRAKDIASAIYQAVYFEVEVSIAKRLEKLNERKSE